jgi:hypothetical protein
MHRDEDVAALSALSGAARRPVADIDGRRPSLRLYQERGVTASTETTSIKIIDLFRFEHGRIAE